MSEEALGTAKLAATIAFFAAAAFFIIANVIWSRKFTDGASSYVENSTATGYSYIKEYLDSPKNVSVAEAYSLFGYCFADIEDVTCSLCGNGAPGVLGTTNESHNRTVEDLCLKKHLTGKCRVNITQSGGLYHMYVSPAT